MKQVYSFSGGLTSAYMGKQGLDRDNEKPMYIFANTGQEREETLNFVNKCDKEWGLDITWVEAVIHHRADVGTTHRIVTYETASRDGEPFEEMIKKYGIPNMAYPHCNRELKLAPIYSYLNAIKLTEFDMNIGIRADEAGRARDLDNRQVKGGTICYPLIDAAPTTKQMINEWWAAQDFSLGLQEYEGNCTWCWKKSMKKHFALLDTNPHFFDFPKRMEEEYPLAGHNLDGTPREFFRGGMSTIDLIEMHEEERRMNPSFVFEFENDDSESCDIFSDCSIDKCSGF